MRLVSVLLVLSLSTPASAENSWSFSVTNHSRQPLTCAEIKDEPPQGPEEVRRWILGYWSGLNSAESSSGGGFVGANRTPEEIYTEVRRFCKSNPDVYIEQAAFAVRYDMKNRGQ